MHVDTKINVKTDAGETTLRLAGNIMGEIRQKTKNGSTRNQTVFRKDYNPARL